MSHHTYILRVYKERKSKRLKYHTTPTGLKMKAYMENPKQQIGSFIKYLSDAVKGHAKPELSPIEYGSEFKSIFNGFIKVACINRKETLTVFLGGTWQVVEVSQKVPKMS